MRTWKQWTFLAIIAFFGIIVSFTACDNDNKNKSQDCTTCETEFGTLAHLGVTNFATNTLEKCGTVCNVANGGTCACTEQFAWLNDVENGVKIRKVSGISVANMSSAIEFFNAEYEFALTGAGTEGGLSKLSEIRLTTEGADVAYIGSILNVRIDIIDTGDADQLLYMIATNAIEPGFVWPEDE